MPDKAFREKVDSAITSGIDVVKSIPTKIDDYLRGTKAQNEKAAEENTAAAKKYPDSAEAKYEKITSKAKGGKVSSASKRADGCVVKGKTRGRMV